MDKPVCRLCNTAHWSSEPHKFGNTPEPTHAPVKPPSPALATLCAKTDAIIMATPIKPRVTKPRVSQSKPVAPLTTTPAAGLCMNADCVAVRADLDAIMASVTKRRAQQRELMAKRRKS